MKIRGKSQGTFRGAHVLHGNVIEINPTEFNASWMEKLEVSVTPPETKKRA